MAGTVTTGICDASIKAAAALSVSEADALDDRAWFAKYPNRLFRARPGDGGTWIIRRRRQGADADVPLRTFTRRVFSSPRNDCDGDLAAPWCRAAYPDWPSEKISEWARKALKKARRS
jgi:hypothetical protein